MKRKLNPRSLKNLRPYQKGKSGNPGGRPKGLIRDATHEWLKQIDAKTGKTNAELVAQTQGKKALKGDTAAYNAVADRTEGKPAQTQQHEVNAHGTVNVGIEIEAGNLLGALSKIYGLVVADS